MSTPSFPNGHLPPSTPPTRRRSRLAKRAGGAAVAIVLVGGIAMNAAASSGSGSYRTAVAGQQDVVASRNEVGVVEPVAQAAVTFPIAGTVATVEVAGGDIVAVGQILATLDQAALQVTINEAQAALDQTELTLQRAIDGDSDGDGDSGTVTRTATSTPVAGQSDSELTAAQRAVLDGQRTVDSRLLAAQDALDTAQQVCAAVGSEDTTTTSTTSPSTTTSSSVTTTSTTIDSSPTTTATAGGTSDTARIESCRTALQVVLDAQQATSDAQLALSSASSTLDALIGQSLAELQAQAASGSIAATASGAVAGSAGVASSPSASELIAYQASVDAAAATLAVAQQALKQAVIVSPIAGTVTSVAMASGDAVDAASSTARIVVVGAGGYEVTTTVSVADLPDIELGQPATVQPDGTNLTLPGEVVSIGVAATSTNGSTTYPVIIGLSDPSADLRNGSIAAVSIVTASASNALVVPTSAVHVDGTQYSVTVVDDGSTETVDVQVGAMGPTWTEITSGLSDGQVVVLADLAEPLPGAATSGAGAQTDATGGRGFGGAGGFPGPR